MGRPLESLSAAQTVERLPGYGEELTRVGERFARSGVLGLLLLDATGLAPIEGRYGSQAYLRTAHALRLLLQEVAGPRLRPDDQILAGAVGRSEVVALLYRPREQGPRLREELRGLGQDLARRLQVQRHRIAYPYLRSAPEIPVGTAVALHNPMLGDGTQLRRALEQAREEASLDSRLARRRRRESLLDLILGEHIYSVYEPIVEVNTRTVYGYEALARGPHGTDLHSPMAMFQVAEEVDLVYELDCVCRRSGLRGANELPHGTKLFLNFLPTAIRDPDFRGDALCRTLERIGLRPQDVVFEISERESIDNFVIFREARDYYGNLGFQIALDDTGAGYSSLQSVMELAPDFIKVDRVFVAGADEDPSRRELLRAFHAVAEKIGAQIIGEGLDTLEELSVLGELGIPFGQGWLFGHPHPLRAQG